MGILRTLRDAPPAHYTLKVESFSLLVKTKIDKYESGKFDAGGYKWTLSLYPNGNQKGSGKDFISLHLAIAETNTLPAGWEVNVEFKMFVFNHNSDKYLTIQDGRVRRFHDIKKEWGFDQLICLHTFNDDSNGYLAGDGSCLFGVEVFVVKYAGEGETLSIIKDPKDSRYTWKLGNFSNLGEKKVLSEEFTVGEHEWQLSLHPKGYEESRNKNLSLYVHLADTSTISGGRKLYVEFKLRIKNQFKNTYHEKGGSHWFSASDASWGYPDFFSLSDLKTLSKGFLVNDTIIVEGQIMFMSQTKNFSKN